MPADGQARRQGATQSPQTARDRADPTWMIVAEAGGSGALAFVLVTAGILSERYLIGNAGLALIITAVAVAASFVILSCGLGKLAPSLFNPVIALGHALGGRLTPGDGLICAAAQLFAAFLGVMIAHIVVGTGLVQVATQSESGAIVWASECLATLLFAGAIFTLTARGQARTALIGAVALLAIALTTPSMSFANPALTLARTLTESFAAIRLDDAIVIAALQLLAGLAAWMAVRRLMAQRAFE